MRPIIQSLAIAAICGHVSASTIVSQVGDIDGLNWGDPADTPSISSSLQAFLAADGSSSIGLDVIAADQRVAFTHFFNIPTGHSVTGATLTVGIRTGNGFVSSDYFGFDRNIDGSHSASSEWGPRSTLFDILGFAPVGLTDYLLQIDLASVAMRTGENGPISNYNLLGDLADGEFNVFFADDSGIDYSILTIETIPSPSTLAVCGLFLAGLRRRRI